MAWEDRGTRNHIKAFIWLNIELFEEGDREVTFMNITKAPIIVTTKADSFKEIVRTGSL